MRLSINVSLQNIKYQLTFYMFLICNYVIAAMSLALPAKEAKGKSYIQQ